MSRARYSIAGLMAVVLVLGVGFAALVRPSRLWAAVLLTGAIALLVVAILGALFGRGRRRVSWAGFAIGGGAYLLMQYGPWFESQVGPFTLPTALIDILYAALQPNPQPPPTPAAPGTGGAMMQMMMRGQQMGGYAGMSGGMPGGTAWTPAAPTPPTSPWTLWTLVDRGDPWPGTGTPYSFYRIAHSLLSLPAGLLGAFLALWFAARREDEEPS